jgi:hypothetical protein
MTVYTYSLSYIDNRNHFNKVGMGTEEQLFDTAVALDRQGAELIEAVREVWEQVDGIARFIKAQPYKMGKPVDA